MIQWNGLDQDLAPGVADLITSVVDPLPALYSVAQGYRTTAYQDQLYRRGRNAQGQVVDPRAVVTNASGANSPHTHGLAVDLYPVVNGAVDYGYSLGAPEPSAAALPAWTQLWTAIGQVPYLTSGNSAGFRAVGLYDPGHIEVTNWRVFTGLPVPAEATATSGLLPPPTAGSGSAPTPEGGLSPDGASLPPSSSGDPLEALRELDPGLVIGVAVTAALALLLYLAARRSRRA